MDGQQWMVCMIYAAWMVPRMHGPQNGRYILCRPMVLRPDVVRMDGVQGGCCQGEMEPRVDRWWLKIMVVSGDDGQNIWYNHGTRCTVYSLPFSAVWCLTATIVYKANCKDQHYELVVSKMAQMERCWIRG